MRETRPPPGEGGDSGQDQGGEKRAEAEQVGQWDQRADRERDEGGSGGDVRRGQFVVIDAEFFAYVQAQGFLGAGRHLAGDLVGQIGVDAVAPEHGG